MPRLLIALVAAVAVAGCAGPQARGTRPGGNPPPPSDRERDIRLMLSYDGNSDGTVTRAELEAGLRRQFMAADTDHDGRLDGDETRAENDRRFRANGTLTSPLIDWNQDGFVSFDEFATTARSVFDELDTNHDGRLDASELRLPRGRAGAGRAPREAGGAMNRRRPGE
jgi:EF hand